LRKIRIAVAAGALLGSSVRADAHLVTTGAGPFYDGAAHLFVSIEELFPVLALALFAGLRGPRAGRLAVALVPLAWTASGLIGLRSPMDAPPALLTALLLLASGALLASDLDLPHRALAAAAIVVSIAVGFMNGAAMAAAGAPALAVFGAIAAAFVVVTLAAALAVSGRAGWMRIAIRVAGSWIAALGLLSLGWVLRA
jgi:hypothetical protein